MRTVHCPDFGRLNKNERQRCSHQTDRTMIRTVCFRLQKFEEKANDRNVNEPR